MTLATRVQALADGSDMGGSLRNPAAWTNVVGLRPSVGVVPSVPPADPDAWLGRHGLMARSVDDLALGMSASFNVDSLCDCVAQMPLRTLASRSCSVRLLTMKNFSGTFVVGEVV